MLEMAQGSSVPLALGFGQWLPSLLGVTRPMCAAGGRAPWPEYAAIQAANWVADAAQLVC